MFNLLLLCDYSREPERRLLKGLSEFAATIGGWRYFHADQSIYQDPLRKKEIIDRIREVNADAVFGRWAGIDKATAESLGIPIILRAGDKYSNDFPVLGGGYHCIGSMAADFFLNQHYQNYAFLGYADICWSRDRWEGFRNRLKENNAEASLHEIVLGDTSKEATTRIKYWLKSLKKPTALTAANDVLASMVAEYCLELGLNIPKDISLLGVDNDEFLCNTAYPKLSSIDLDYEDQGYRLGMVIHEMYQQKRSWLTQIKVTPIKIRERESTLKHNISNPHIKHIVEIMDHKFNTDLSLDEILSDIPLSRRSIEMLFKKEMAPYTLLSYLNKLRIDCMCKLLASSDMPVNIAAAKSGFSDSFNINRTFKKYTGMTPSEYRASQREKQ